MRWTPLLCALAGPLLGGCAAHLECTAHGGPPVYELVTDHFVVTSDLPEAKVKKEAERLELLWDTFVVFFGKEPDAQSRVNVVALRGGETADFKPETSGFFATTDTPVVVTDVTDEGSASAHELVHLISRFWLPIQPTWLSEGLAMYLGDAEFTNDTVVHMGRWRYIAPEAEDLPALWAWRNDDAERTGRLYSSAWAWVHFLANSDSGRLFALFTRLRARQPPQEAFNAVFPPAEHAALHEGVLAHLRAGRFRAWRTLLRRVPKVSAPRVLAPWEVHVVRMQLLEQTGWPKRAEAELAAALALAPSPVPPRLEVERLSLRPAFWERSEAARLFPDDARAQTEAAWALDLSRKQRLQAAHRAVALAPDDVRAQLALAAAALAVGELEEAESASVATLALAPWSVHATLVRLQVQVARGQCQAARDTLSGLSPIEANSADLKRLVDQQRSFIREACREAAP